MFGNCCNSDERPCDVITIANGFEPCGFNRVACCGMNVADGVSDAWEFIYIVEILRKYWGVHACVDVLSCNAGVGDLVHSIQVSIALGCVNNDGVDVHICDSQDKWYALSLSRGHRHLRRTAASDAMTLVEVTS